MIQINLLRKKAINDGICDNTDCEHKNHQFTEVRMKDEFGHDIVKWCQDCIERDKEMLEICEWCDVNGAEREIYFEMIYHPFDKFPSFEGLLCIDCMVDIYYCETCDRQIFESNGMRRNIRFTEYDTICVSCLQKQWFVEGMERFQDGDWFNDKDLLEHGFDKHKHYFCDYENAEKEFIYLQENGFIVIVSITASGMGLEHYYDIWKKEFKDE